MRIALDAMGSDDYPKPDVAGAVQAATEYRETVVLVGDETKLKAELANHQTAGLPIEIVHAPDVITMEDSPSKVGRTKPHSSIQIGLDLVEQGACDGFVSVGNTGAILAITTLYKLKRIPGVFRPALSSIVPVPNNLIIMLDIGANVDCKPEWLVQFALMGSIYAEHSLKRARPKVALLSNGEEEGKGNGLIHETGPLLAGLSGINYIGNIEPKEMMQGAADVVVHDGFVGNMVAKSLEAMGVTLFDSLREEITASWRGKVGGLLLRPAFRSVYRRYDPFEIGGAPLLGVNGVVIIGHGRSTPLAIKNAIRQARQAFDGGIVQAITAGIAKREPTT